MSTREQTTIDKIQFKKVVDWIITAVCPLRCEHCIVGELVENAKERKKFELNTQECKELIDHLAENGTKVISVTGGEVLTRKDVLEIFDYANGKGLKVNLYTTGLNFYSRRKKIIKSEITDKTLDKISFLGISIDTFHDQANKEILAEEYCEDLIRSLFKYSSDKYPNLEIQLFTVLGKRNSLDPVKDIIDECERIGIIITNISKEIKKRIRWRLSPFRYNPGSMLHWQKELLFTAEEIGFIVSKLTQKLNHTEYFSMHFGVDYDSFFIYPDGKFRTVILDDKGIDRFIELGSFRENEVKNIEHWERLIEQDGITAKRMKRKDLIPFYNQNV